MSSILKAQTQNDCKDLDKISVEIINTVGNSANGKVIIRADEINLKDFTCFLYAPKKNDNRMNFRLADGTIDHLKTGTYILFVQDNSGNGCTRKFSIKIN